MKVANIISNIQSKPERTAVGLVMYRCAVLCSFHWLIAALNGRRRNATLPPNGSGLYCSCAIKFPTTYQKKKKFWSLLKLPLQSAFCGYSAMKRWHPSNQRYLAQSVSKASCLLLADSRRGAEESSCCLFKGDATIRKRNNLKVKCVMSP